MPNILYDERNGRVVGGEKQPDDMALGHVYTFGSIIKGGSESYFHGQWDEALKHNRRNALAMRRDCFLMGLIEERIRAVTRNKWHIEVDSPKDPRQKMVADGLTKIIKDVPKLKRFMNALSWAKWYGRYANQVKWEWDTMELPLATNSGPIVPGSTPQVATMQRMKYLRCAKHKPVNGDKLGNEWDGTPYVLVNGAMADRIPKSEIIYTTQAPGLLLRGTWRERFVIHTHAPDDADYFEGEMAGGIYGVGIRSRIYWLDFMRREYVSWVVETLQRIGLGIVVIYYDASNPDAKLEAKKAAKRYSRKSALVLPRTMDGRGAGGVEVVDAPVSGAQIVQELQQHIEDVLERYIVGQSMSSGADNDSGLGGTGRANFAADTKQDIVAEDAEELAETMTGSVDEPGLVSVIKRWTYSWADFPARLVFNVDDVDPAKKLDAVKNAVSMGVSFPEGPVRELTGIPAPEEGEPTIGGAGATLPGEGDDPFGGGEGDDDNPFDDDAGDPDKPRDDGPDAPPSSPRQHYSEEYAAEIMPSIFDAARRLGPAGRPFLEGIRDLLKRYPNLRQKVSGADLALLGATHYGEDAEGHEHRGKGKGGGQFAPKGQGGAGAESAKKKGVDAKAKPTYHPGSAHGSSVSITTSKQRAFNGKDPIALKNPLTKQETGRVGEAIVLAYLKSQGFDDAKPMNSGATNFPIDMIEDHRPTEVKAGLASNGRKAQQWRLTFSKETKTEIEAYDKMDEGERAEWNAEKQKRIKERKQAVISDLEKKYGKPIHPRTVTVVINPDTQTADIYAFDGFHDRIDWQSDLAKKSYVGSVTYAH